VKRVILGTVLSVGILWGGDYTIADSFQYPIKDSEGIYNSTTNKGWFVAQDFQDCREEPVPAGLSPCRHLGEDWNYYDGKRYANENREILSIGNGYVVTSGVVKGFAGYVIVKHYLSQTDESKYVLSIYGHLQTSGLPRAKTYLKKGDLIAKTATEEEMKKWTTFGPHLHFEIRKPKSITGYEDTYLNDGYEKTDKYYDPTDVKVFDYNNRRMGSIDWNTKAGFIEHYQPETMVETVNESSEEKYLPIGIFDGAGSLISPNESCWGCDKDEARMHPHYPRGSTVVFQWVYDKETCEHIDIYADRDLEVVIRAKNWSSDKTESAVKGVVGRDKPISIKSTNLRDLWSNIAVTSTSPVSETVKIVAYCKRDIDPIHRYGIVEFEKNLVYLTQNYFWAGTGSLITKATARDFDSSGIGKDFALSLSKYRSFTSFQWYTSNQCPSITIKEYGSSSKIDEIKIKEWSSKNWSENLCSSLPCTINAPTIDNYYIIKVKREPDVTTINKYIIAECNK
jgi:hypothetical protein